MSTTRSVTHLLNTTWTETFYANKFKQKSSNSLSYKHHGNKLMKITPKWKFTFFWFFFCIQYKTLRTSIKLKSLTKNCPTPFSPPLSPTIKNFQQLNSLIEIRKKFFFGGSDVQHLYSLKKPCEKNPTINEKSPLTWKTLTLGILPWEQKLNSCSQQSGGTGNGQAFMQCVKEVQGVMSM